MRTPRTSGVRVVAKELGLPEEIWNRPPFPGPALSARVVGEVTRERVATVRAATAIVEEELKGCGAFQYLAIIHQDHAKRFGASELAIVTTLTERVLRAMEVIA